MSIAQAYTSNSLSFDLSKVQFFRIVSSSPKYRKYLQALTFSFYISYRLQFRSYMDRTSVYVLPHPLQCS
jgi:hypothetical protein